MEQATYGDRYCWPGGAEAASGNDQAVFKTFMVFEQLHDLGHSGTRLADGAINADDTGVLLG